MKKKNTKVKSKSDILTKTFKNNREYFEFVGKNKDIKVTKLLLVDDKVQIYYKKV